MFSSSNVLTHISALLRKLDFRTRVLVLIMAYWEAVGQTRVLKPRAPQWKEEDQVSCQFTHSQSAPVYRGNAKEKDRVLPVLELLTQ